MRNGENHGVGNSYAPRGGAAEPCLLVDADYSQIELRVLAHMSGDETAVREIKELAGAIKELSALNASLKSAAPPADSAVQVAFDPSGDTWRQ